MKNKYKIPEGSLISFMSNLVKAQGGINLAQGIPGYQPPSELLDALSKLIHTDIHQYAPGFGNAKLLELLSAHYGLFPADDFLITQGATEAIALIYIYLSQKTKEDFNVMAIDPVYESYKHLPGIFKHAFHPFYLENDFSIDFDKLESEVKGKHIRLLLISSPGNPYGKAFDKTEMDRMLSLADQYDFNIIFDAVYKDLYFETPPYLPLKNLNERVFYVNSFSKMLSITGWRIGYFIAHPKHMKHLRTIHDYIGLCAPSLFQQAIADFLETSNFAEHYLQTLRAKLKLSYQNLETTLKKLHFEFPPVDGGYFIWTKLPDGFDNGFQFAIDLYEQQKVAVIPGIHFSDKGHQYIRINIAHEIQMIEEAVLKLKHFVNKF